MRGGRRVAPLPSQPVEDGGSGRSVNARRRMRGPLQFPITNEGPEPGAGSNVLDAANAVLVRISRLKRNM